jgi:hypothetical protein
MTELRELLSRVDETPAPDVWDDATHRPPGRLPSTPIRSRVIAGVVAVFVVAGAALVLGHALGSERPKPATTTPTIAPSPTTSSAATFTGPAHITLRPWSRDRGSGGAPRRSFAHANHDVWVYGRHFFPGPCPIFITLESGSRNPEAEVDIPASVRFKVDLHIPGDTYGKAAIRATQYRSSPKFGCSPRSGGFKHPMAVLTVGTASP